MSIITIIINFLVKIIIEFVTKNMQTRDGAAPDQAFLDDLKKEIFAQLEAAFVALKEELKEYIKTNKLIDEEYLLETIMKAVGEIDIIPYIPAGIETAGVKLAVKGLIKVFVTLLNKYLA